MMERWFGIVDGVVVTSSLDEKFVYRYKEKKIRCTVVPYEASFRVNGKLAICTELPDGDLAPSSITDWERQ